MVRAASERRGNNLKGCKDFYLKAQARIWPCLFDVCRIRSTAEADKGAGTCRARLSANSASAWVTTWMGGFEVERMRNAVAISCERKGAQQDTRHRCAGSQCGICCVKAAWDILRQ